MIIAPPFGFMRKAATPGGFTPKCYDFSSGTNLYLTNSPDASGMAVETSGFTLVAAFQVPDADFGNTQSYYIAGCTFSAIFFERFDPGTTARKISFELRGFGNSQIWLGKSTTALAKGQKYVVALSYEDGVRRQLYLNGVAETVDSETLNGGNVRTDLSYWINADRYATFNTNSRISHIWMDDSSVDLASVAGNFSSGSTPLDYDPGFALYMKMDDFVNDGTVSTTFTAPNGPPTNEDY